MTYAGRTIWITGAASGIGAGLARAFHAAGGTIVASDRDEGGLVALSKVLGDRVTVLPFEIARVLDANLNLLARLKGKRGRRR